MKNLIPAFLLIAFFPVVVSCSSANGKDNKSELKEITSSTIEENTENSNQPVVEETTVQSKPINLTKALFLEKVMNYEVNQTEWVFEGDLPCLIDFYADWCRPCKITSPILDELAEEYAGKINIYKINTEHERELAAVFGVSSIPTFLYCPKDGKPQMASGIARTPEETKQMFRNLIDELLLNKPASN